jgi:hypothetical protein
MIKNYSWYILFFMLLLAIVFIVGFNGLYGQDSYEYLRYTKCLNVFFRTGTNPGEFFWPVLYPALGSLLAFICSPIFALQLISIASFVGAAIYLDKTIDLLFSPNIKTKNVFVFLFFLLSPYLLRASMVVMSDMLSVFFVTGAYYYYFKYRASLQGKHFFWFVLMAMAAIATRYASFVLLIVPGLAIKINFLKHFKWKAFVASACAAALIALPHLFLHHNEPLGFISHYLAKKWSPLNMFNNAFVTAEGNTHFIVFNIVYVFYNLFHPAFCFAGLILMLAVVKFHIRNKEMIIPGLSILLYALFLAGIPFQDLRFLILSFPLVAILFFPAYEQIMNYLAGRNFNKTKNIIIYALVAVIQLALFYRVFIPFYHDNKVEKQIATEVLKYPNIPIYTFSIEGALGAYGANNRIINLFSVKLDTVPPISGQKLVLFNEKQFAQDWKGLNPMLNWDYLQKNLKLSKIADLPDGWELYNAQ